jgi:undecaprenyl-diphosphatase
MAVTFSSAAGLGVLQGLTEFLPVSSSGHLRLAEAWIGGITQPLALDVALHMGTLLAVLIYYRADLVRLLTSMKSGGCADDRREIGFIVVASIPTALIGIGLKKLGVEHFGPLAVAGGLLTTSLLDYSTSLTRGGEATLTWGRAFAIGAVQGVAVLPGVSRSGSTIAASMMMGIPPVVAARFSFLCSIPAIGGAALLTTKDYIQSGDTNLAFGPLVLGIVLSFVIGYLCLEFLMRQVEKGSFKIWAVYTFILAILVLIRTQGWVGGFQ